MGEAMRNQRPQTEKTGNARQTRPRTTTTRFLQHCVPGLGDTAMNDWIKVPSLLPPTTPMPKEGER